MGPERGVALRWLVDCSTTCRATTPLIPSFLRYRVRSYSVHLTTDDRRVDTWHYHFELHRQRDQKPFEKTMQHPCADEMDDWNDYQKLKGGRQGEGLMSLPFATHDRKSPVSLMTDSDTDKKLFAASGKTARSLSIVASENVAKRALSVDSGYSTSGDYSAMNGSEGL